MYIIVIHRPCKLDYKIRIKHKEGSIDIDDVDDNDDDEDNNNDDDDDDAGVHLKEKIVLHF